MKKLLSIIMVLVFILTGSSKAWHDVSVYAVVWNVNKPPRIIKLSPDFNPVLVWVNEYVSVDFSVEDEESDMIYYTITSDDWITAPNSWSFNWSASLNFVYRAPQTPPAWWFSKIYITLNDSVNFVVKELNLYIY